MGTPRTRPSPTSLGPAPPLPPEAPPPPSQGPGLLCPGLGGDRRRQPCPVPLQASPYWAVRARAELVQGGQTAGTHRVRIGHRGVGLSNGAPSRPAGRVSCGPTHHLRSTMAQGRAGKKRPPRAHLLLLRVYGVGCLGVSSRCSGSVQEGELTVLPAGTGQGER